MIYVLFLKLLVGLNHCLFYDPLERVRDRNPNKARLNFLTLSGTEHTESEWLNLEKVVRCLLYPTLDVSSTRE